MASVSQNFVRSGIIPGERGTYGLLGRILERPGPPLVPLRVNMGRVIQRVKRASVARVRPSGPAMPVVSGRPPCGGEGSAALDKKKKREKYIWLCGVSVASVLWT